jgi:hypothetical protein
MDKQEHFTWQKFSVPLSKTDMSCSVLGKDLLKPSSLVHNEPAESAQSPPEETYERKYSMLQRFYKLIVSPSEAMKDIGLWPEYGGPLVLVILETVLAAATVSLAFQKIQWTGDPQIISQVQNTISEVITLAVVLSAVLFLAFWLVKSWLVKALCDGGSGWSFETAASVTGYAYLADIIFGIISLLVVYPLLPSVTLNASDLDATRQALANFQAQTLWIELAVAIPIGFIALLWKSYLGGLGTKFGTLERCSVRLGFVVFLILALLGWLISFLIRGTI